MVEAKMKQGFDLYGGSDPADLPRYSAVDAARATNVPASTVGVWARGMSFKNRSGKRGFYEPVIDLPDPNDTRLSFNNLLEIWVLRALRKQHDIKLQAVREAIESAKSHHGVARPLLNRALRVSGKELFFDYYFKLVSLSNSEQFAIRSVLETSLLRVKIESKLRASLFPIVDDAETAKKPLILVSPYIAFGSAVVERRGITTSAIRARYDLGEKREAIIADYRLKPEEFDEALRYETAAA